MINSFVLVKNLRSNSEELHFAGFKLVKIGSSWDYDLKRAQHLFPKAWPLYKDWVYEKGYNDNDEREARIPFDVEDTLLLLRLFKPGDLVFLSPCIENAGGELLSQLPYRVMAYIHTTHMYNIQSEECPDFDTFANEIRSQKNWSSTCFQTARRFFLYGGGKEYNPKHNEVDRVVDYMTALETILVPERDGFIGRRLRERAVSLLRHHNIDRDDTKRLLRDFYDVRCAVVHGSDISPFKSGILTRNIDFETVVRKIIVEALKALPDSDNDRVAYLKQLFDVSDQNRTEKVYSDFCSIKSETEKRKCFDLISSRLS
jgi:hypothetical protein